MGYLDDLLAANQARGTVDPNVSAWRGNIAPQGSTADPRVLADMARSKDWGTQGIVPSFNPLGPNVAPSPALQAGSAAARLAANQAEGYGLGSNKDDGGFSWGAVGKGMLKGLDWIDTPRAAVVSTLKELGDVTGLAGGDGSWDWGDWYQNSANNMGAGELAEQIMGPDGTNRPMWMRRAVGFIGDVGLDPLTWMSGGTIAAVKGAGKAGGKLAAKEMGSAVIDQALKGASRTDISGAIGRTAAAKKLAGEITEQELKIITDWQKIGGTKGRAALRRSERESVGMTDELMGKLGVNSKLGLSFGTRNHRFNIPGTERIASRTEAMKGATKLGVASTKNAARARKLFTAEDKVWGDLYREATTEVLTGSDNAAQAAMSLVHIKDAKAMADVWGDNLIKELTTKFSWLGKSVGRTKAAREGALTAAEGKTLLELVESGAHRGAKPAGVSDELFNHAKELSAWFDEQFKYLVDNGVNMSQRHDYIPHIASKEWMEFEQAKSEWSDAYRKVSGQAKDADFVMTRQLDAGDDWFGYVLKDTDLPLTVQRLNDIAVANGAPFRPLAEDPGIILEKYIESAKNQLLKDNLLKRNTASGFVGSKKAVVNQVKQAAYVKNSLQQSTKARAGALAITIKNTRKLLKTARETVKKVESELRAYEATVLGYQRRANKLQAELDSLEAGFEQLVGLNPRKLKSQANAKIKRVEAEIAAKRVELDAANLKLSRARSPKTKQQWTDAVVAANKAVDQLEGDLAGAIATREGLERFMPDGTPLPRRAGATGDSGVIRTSEQAERQADQTLAKIKKNEAEQFAILGVPGESPSTLTYWTRNPDSIKADLNDAGLKAMQDRTDLELAGKFRDENMAAGRPKTEDEISARNELLVDQIGFVTEAMARQGDDATYQLLLAAEAQALVYDANTAALRQSAKEIQAGVQSAIDNPAFQDRIMWEVEQGFKELDATTQALPFYVEAMKRVPDIRVAAERKALKKAIKGYDRGMNVWKSWATASPGFVVRNMYSGFFNMYLDGVDPKNYQIMQRYLREYEGWVGSTGGRGTGGFDAANAWAARKGYSPEEIGYFQGAIEAAAGSGWGLTPVEVSQRIGNAERASLGQRLNPVNESFAPARSIRNLSSAAEAKMRAGHAFDVLVKGGDVNQAITRLEKFHFNYKDVSSLDRAMKRVMPFWMFYSRNMALQANVWTRMPAKLNRSYFNAKRNLALGADEESLEPGYFEQGNAMQMAGFGTPDAGSQWYFTPDIPSNRFMKDVGDLGNLNQLFSSTAPPIKSAAQLIAGKNLFTGAPFKDRLNDFDAEGQSYNRRAPLPLNIPGIRNVTSPLIDSVGDALGVLPGLDVLGSGMESVDGQLLMTDRVQNTMEDFLPLIGRVGRLAPNNPKDQSRVADRWLSFGGIPVKQNTNEMMAGEQYRRALQIQEDAKRLKQQAQIRNG